MVEIGTAELVLSIRSSPAWSDARLLRIAMAVALGKVPGQTEALGTVAIRLCGALVQCSPTIPRRRTISCPFS